MCRFGVLQDGVHGALFWGLCERTSCLRTFCAGAVLEWQSMALIAAGCADLHDKLKAPGAAAGLAAPYCSPLRGVNCSTSGALE
jgi:hypothetical protein